MLWSISAGYTPFRSSNLGKSCCCTMTSRGSRRVKPRWNRLFWKREGRRGLLSARPSPSSMGSTTMRRYKNYIIFSVDLIFTITLKHITIFVKYITISGINPHPDDPSPPSPVLPLFSAFPTVSRLLMSSYSAWERQIHSEGPARKRIQAAKRRRRRRLRGWSSRWSIRCRCGRWTVLFGWRR